MVRPTILLPKLVVSILLLPLKYTSIPSLAVMTPTESILVTSSYVSVPPIDTLPLNVVLPAESTLNLSVPAVSKVIVSLKGNLIAVFVSPV